jgi:ABC-type dipeptide/oligopeptide/nickel transport system permease subunit
VVATRIVVGVLLGGLAGWFGGRVAWLIDGLTTISLSVPLLAVSIAVLSALDISRGLGVFVVALTITAWCDTAALVKNRTQAVLHSPYIESARAIGAKLIGLFWRHVLPQLRPVLPVMIALELSSVYAACRRIRLLRLFYGRWLLVHLLDW